MRLLTDYEIILRLLQDYEITLRLPDYLEITGLLLRLLRLRQDYRDYFGITDQHVRDFFELFTPRINDPKLYLFFYAFLNL